MTDEFETMEIEVSEDDIVYFLIDEDGNEVGFVIEEDGAEVECYYEGYDCDDFEVVDEVISVKGDGDDGVSPDDSLASHDGDLVELEVSEDDIEYYLFDEEGNEIGFAVEEDGVEIECYYADDDEPDGELAACTGQAEPGAGQAEPDAGQDAFEPYVAQKAEDHGYLHKLASIAGHEGNKARKKAEVQLDKVRDKAEVQVDKAKKAAAEQAGKAKAKADEADLGITRENLKETTADLNAIAKEGAETAKELKEAYDDIMDNFGFLVPKKARRKLP